MLAVLQKTWPLFLGILLLMVGNGMQGTLLGIRGAIEGIPTGSMAVVMSGYYAGFLAGSMVVPRLIRRVGHVRVFAALGALVAAVLLVFPLAPLWWIWAAGRLVVGFCFCGVYITAESWLNASTTNELRGRALSAYMMMQMAGMVASQGLLNLGDPAGFLPFIIPSMLVSLAFLPILLSTQEAPRFDGVRRMSLLRLWRISPLGCVGVMLCGGVFAAMIGMGPVWGAAAGLNTREISAFIAALYIGGLICQYPMGWVSDRMDRRVVILGLALAGAAAIGALLLLRPGIWGLLAVSAVIGGVANPLYSLLVSHANDRLEPQDMPAASAGLSFIYGASAAVWPLLTGWVIATFGLQAYWVQTALILLALAGYTAWRLRRSEAATGAGFRPVTPAATRVALEAAMAEGAPPPRPAPSPGMETAGARPAGG